MRAAVLPTVLIPEAVLLLLAQLEVIGNPFSQEGDEDYVGHSLHTYLLGA